MLYIVYGYIQRYIEREGGRERETERERERENLKNFIHKRPMDSITR